MGSGPQLNPRIIIIEQRQEQATLPRLNNSGSPLYELIMGCIRSNGIPLLRVASVVSCITTALFNK